MATRRKLTTPPARRRVELKKPAEDDEIGSGPSYFASGADKEQLQFVQTGCSLLDEALGGGPVLGRVINVVGDRSVGKTLLVMEIAANFLRDYEDQEGWVRYGESEAAFDRPYAAALGIPVERILFNDGDKPLETVEDLYEDMVKCLDENKGRPGVYVIDSLDALSDEAELKRDFNEGSYGGTKPKAIGKLFRLLVERLHQQNVLFIVVSQIRDKLNVTFGETKTRSGGRALDFYCTHILWLAEIQKEKRKVQGIERVVGIEVEANVKKNKVGLPHRKIRYSMLFGYGIDDLTAGIEWLIANNREGRLAEMGMSKTGFKVKVNALRNQGGPEVAALREQLRKIIREEWAAIETTFLPKARKY